jgi:hypothetical protein
MPINERNATDFKNELGNTLKKLKALYTTCIMTLKN